MNDFNVVANKIKKRKTNEVKDVFYTPLNLVRLHLNYVKKYVGDGDVVFDPFFGTGNYYNTFSETFTNNNTFDYTEITLGRDFFAYDKTVGAIISNPPYSLMDKVLEKSCNLNPHTISYLIGLHNITARRIEKMNNRGYYLVDLMMLKVSNWFGMSCIVVFRKGEGINKNCIDFDRTIYFGEKAEVIDL
jgi:hypothetical protein